MRKFKLLLLLLTVSSCMHLPASAGKQTPRSRASKKAIFSKKKVLLAVFLIVAGGTIYRLNEKRMQKAKENEEKEIAQRKNKIPLKALGEKEVSNFSGKKPDKEHLIEDLKKNSTYNEWKIHENLAISLTQAPKNSDKQEYKLVPGAWKLIGELKKFLNGVGKYAKFALVDVDKTLIVEERIDGKKSYSINQGLIEELKEAGVRNVALFTRMAADKIINEFAPHGSISSVTRQQVIEALEKNGITVWAVITNADHAYGKGLGAAYLHALEKKLTNAIVRYGTAKPHSDLKLDDELTNLWYQYHSLQADKTADEQNKVTMFTDFMKACSGFEGTLFLIDDDSPLDGLSIVPLTIPGEKVMLSAVEKMHGNIWWLKLKEDGRLEFNKHLKQKLIDKKNAEEIEKEALELEKVGNNAEAAKRYKETDKLRNHARGKLIPNFTSILYTAAEEYLKKKPAFRLVCIQVPSMYWVPILKLKDVTSGKYSIEKIKTNSITPHTKAYYRAIFSGYPDLKSSQQPLVYRAPELNITDYYFKKKLAEKAVKYNWGLCCYGPNNKKNEDTFVLTLIQGVES